VPKGWAKAIRSISAIFSRSLPKQVALVALGSWALVLILASISILLVGNSVEQSKTPQLLRFGTRAKPSPSPFPETATNTTLSSPSPKPFRYVAAPDSNNPSPRPLPTWPARFFEGNGTSFLTSISADGRYVVFYSEASNLVSGDTNGQSDIFVRNVNIEYFTRVSVSSAGTQSNSYSFGPSISADGRYVAFDSNGSNLASGDTNGTQDVFVRDAWGGTSRASVSSMGAEGDGRSFLPAISPNGRYVAFYSDASNLVPGDTNGFEDVFVRDTVAGTTTRVSLTSSGEEGNRISPCVSPVYISFCGFRHRLSVSATGRYIAFTAWASFDSSDLNSLPDIYLHDLITGKTTLISVTSQGNSQLEKWSDSPAISAEGRYVAFTSQVSDLVPGDTNGNLDVFVRDTVAGTTTRASVSSIGEQGNNLSDLPSISPDGRYVTFLSLASNLTAGDTNNHSDVFVKDLKTGAIARVSISSTGKQGNADSYESSISASGRYVTFSSDATNLVSGDTNGKTDVFIRDLISGAARRITEWTDRFYPL
jgi:Tol biopolymer transport system component